MAVTERSARRLAMNWTDCPVVEIVPGKVSGAPVIAHSRVRPEDLIANREEGPEWLAENFGLPLETVRTVLAFYERKAGRAPHPV
jgi:uncharacterized protein (DUF433 family)